MNQNSFPATIIRLALISVTLGFLAFVAFPWASTLPPVQARIKFNNEKQINGGATFYTEHPFLMNLLAEREACKD